MSAQMNIQLIRYLNLFSRIPAADMDVISSFFEARSYQESDSLFRGNGICKEMFFTCSGVLRIGTFNARGSEVTHYFYKENQLCTILPSFDDRSIGEAGIFAACPAEVLAISRDKLLELYQRLPYLQPLIDQIHQQRLLEKIHTRNAYIGEDAETQYKLFIMSQPDIVLRVSVKHVASYLGITPQSLSRIRKHIR